ncbi:hypothetical protein H9635_04820 [Solibacillus sp. A46]|uniref:Uncharacterized protein n=1 Tax=Solibacillus faecavium TaxID=2762221 RepID=A0ABR8XW46_9BACL|nr:hypothetical protein [Solibacillus faecavium]MBD8036054.1 hypothetical protein [Solibacillus faecavium]
MTIGQHIRVLFCVVIMGCIVGFVLNGEETATSSPYIDFVKAQQWPFNEELLIADVFDGHYEITYWEYFTARTGQHVVQLTGTNEEQQDIYQFVVEEDYSDFTIGAVKQNNILLTPERKWTYIKKLVTKKASNAGEILAGF